MRLPPSSSDFFLLHTYKRTKERDRDDKKKINHRNVSRLIYLHKLLIIGEEDEVEERLVCVFAALEERNVREGWERERASGFSEIKRGIRRIKRKENMGVLRGNKFSNWKSKI